MTGDDFSGGGHVDVMHGVTLKMIVTRLYEKFGWQELGRRVNINCFTNDPSINSSLKFLRKTPWAREKVETLYASCAWGNKNIWPDSEDEESDITRGTAD